MKKRFLFILAFLLISSANALYEEVIYDGDVLSEYPFSIQGREYEAIYIRETNNTVLYYPDGIRDVIYYNNESCSEQWIYRSCISNIRFTSHGRPVPQDVHEVNINITLHLKIYASYAKLYVSRQIDKTELFSGETFVVTTTLENQGELKAENISILDTFPAEFKIMSAVGCTILDNFVYWNGSLNSEAKKKCTYTVKAVKQTKYDSLLQVNYAFLDRAVSSSDKKTITVTDIPLDIEISKDRLNLSPTEPVEIKYKITGKGNVDINSFRIVLPEQFTLMNHSEEFTPIPISTLRWFGQIYNNQKKEFYINFNTKYIGNFSIISEIMFTYNNKLNNFTKIIPVETTADIFYVWSVPKEDSISLRAINPTRNTFSNIMIDVYQGNEKQGSYKIDELAPLRYKEFHIPKNESLYYLIRYRTQYGQYLNFRTDFQTTLNNKLSGELAPVEEPSPQEPVIEDTVTEQKKGFSLPEIHIPETYLVIIVPLFIIVIVTLCVFKFVFSGKGGGDTNLDKEIEELKKQE